MTKWALAFILLMFATGDGFPIYFSERIYRTLDQLDEALANGEISQEYYDEFVDAFTGYPSSASTAEDLRPNMTVLLGTYAIPRWNYTSTYRQRLESNFGSSRYDRISCMGRGFTGSIAFEKLTAKSLLVRSTAFSIWRSKWHLNVGNLNFEYANSLTIGRPALHKELHDDNDFGTSLLYPTRNRKNGIEFEREVGAVTARVYVSRLQGDRYYAQSVGGDLERRTASAKFGLMALRQQASQRGGRSKIITYLVPHTAIGHQDRRLSTESSFQVGGASAHSLRGDLQTGHLRQALEFFSYGKAYANLESGGYAYSDFDDAAIEGTGLEYRDKRPGRIGLSIEQFFNFNAESAFGQIVRWNNRLDGRKCVASRMQYAHSDHEVALRVQAIYQDLDLEGGSDIRKLVAAAAEFQPTVALKYEIQHKIEQRILNGSKRYPFRSRHDFTWSIDPRFKAMGMVNYYDGDLQSGASAQVMLALGLEIEPNKDLRFSARCQSRYRFSVERLDTWELRLNCEATL